MIKAVITDIDGVLTDGKAIISSGGYGKTICFKDLDSFVSLRAGGILLGVLTGEKDFFTQYIKEKIQPDLFVEGCRDKGRVLKEFSEMHGILLNEICYIGDGKYDMDAIKIVGLGCCPHDAIDAIKNVSDIVLMTDGGNGCISEIQGIISRFKEHKMDFQYRTANKVMAAEIEKTVKAHFTAVACLLEDREFVASVSEAVERITDSLRQGGKLFLCGNGGSAADAQHIATELVSRFYMERRALNAEALTVNTSSLTAIANDYTYNKVFARQVEAGGKAGDVIIGISTSGSSKNIIEAFKEAKSQNMLTIAFVGKHYEKMVVYADIVVSVPAMETPRIQEMHILTGHILCEQIERVLCG